MFEFLRSKTMDYPRFVHGNPSHAEILVVNWFMGNTCNYECSYCPTELHDGSKNWVELEHIQNFVKKLRQTYGKNKKLVFEFTGGEITLKPDFLKMIQFLKESDCIVGIISNGSRAKAFWGKARPFLDQVCLSFHPESAKADHFIEIATFLSDAVRLHLNFMMHPQHFYYCYETALRAKGIANVSIALQPLIVDFGTELYQYSQTQKTLLDKQYSLIGRFVSRTKDFPYYRGSMLELQADGTAERKDPHRLIATGQNSWKGWQCYAGVEQMVVNADGWIHRGWCKVGGPIGHVRYWTSKLPDKPVTCNRDSCHCNFDIMSTKIKSRRAAQ